MSNELIEIVLSIAAVLVGVWGITSANSRSLRKDTGGLREEMNSGFKHFDGKLDKKIGTLDTKLTKQIGVLDEKIGELDTKLTKQIADSSESLRETMMTLHAETKAELRSLNARLDLTNTRIDRLADRLPSFPEPEPSKPNTPEPDTPEPASA